MAGEIKSVSANQGQREVIKANNDNSTVKTLQTKNINNSDNNASPREIETKRSEISIETNYWRERLNSTLPKNPNENNGGAERTVLAQAEQIDGTGSAPSVDAAVERVIAESERPGGNPGAVLAEELRQGDAAFQAQVMGELARQSPGAMARVLSETGNTRNSDLDASQQQTITQALSSAASQGTLPNDFTDRLVSEARILNSYNTGPEFYRGIATAIGNTGSTRLSSAYARSVIDYVNNPPYPLDPGSVVAAEQEMLLSSAGVAIQNNPRAIENTLSYLRQNPLLGEEAGRPAIARFVTAMAGVPNQNGHSVLGDFLAGAGGARFSDARELFEIVSNDEIRGGYVWLGNGYYKDNLIDAPGVRDGLSRLFLSQSSNFLNHYTSFPPNDGSGRDVYNAQTLSNFYRLTTLSEQAPYGDRIVDATKRHIDSLRTQIETGVTPDGRQLTVAQRESLARQNGRIIGSIIGAYNEAIRDYRNLDASNDQRTRNATTVASLIVTGAAGLAFAPLAAPIYITAGVQGGRIALNHFLTNGTVGEEELKSFEDLIQNNFNNYYVQGGNLDVQGVTPDQANTIRTEVFDGMNEMIIAWAIGEGVLSRP